MTMGVQRNTTDDQPALTRGPTGRAAPRHPVTAVVAVVGIGMLTLAGCTAGTPAEDAAETGTGTDISTPAAFDADTVAQFDALVREFQDVNQTPGVLVGVWSPQGTYVSATGTSDLATGTPLEPDMQFKIASQTKTFTGNLILQLVSEGEVDFDDHISEWVEGVPNGDEITIRQLLNHTSGLANGFTAPTIQAKTPEGCTVEELLTLEAEFPPIAEPGEEWSYSNYGFNLLGRVVEVVEGEDLSTVLERRITEPLGMTRTSLVTSGNGLTEPFTRGYGAGELGPTQAATAENDATWVPLSCLWAHGGMVSTLEDLHVWLSSMSTLVSPEVWEEANAEPVPFVFEGDYNGPGEWFNALGFVVTGGFVVAEGSFAGYESSTMYSPELDTTIAVVTTKIWNAITPPPMMQALAMTLYGDEVDFGLTIEQAMEPNLSIGTAAE
ncbi:serine hydrolase [Agromyces sp. Marseille-P2726]|uniref:serine hydrolase domain-containing protein n=1 Tax=Agromyces sp. Marseille-P2726 TaxID=2709132 RepID=UPI00156EA619|nr:serine hydrolase domain-containing protein [Agromyces sp. Marseille-P2726]